MKFFFKASTQPVPINNIDSFNQRSSQIFDVFTKTKEDALTLNSEIDMSVKEKEQQVLQLQSEISTLNGISKKNANLATKIDKFLFDEPETGVKS